MTHAKPIIGLLSSGLGVALVVFAIHVQNDNFALTSSPSQADTLTHATFPAPTPVNAAPAARPVMTLDVVNIVVDPLRVTAKRPAATRHVQSTEKAIQVVQPPCNSTWRELNSGPAGARVREICTPAGDTTPRS